MAKKKSKKKHLSLRVLAYGSISGVSVGILMYFCRGILEPHEAIKIVEFATVSMLCFEHIV